MQAAVVIGGSSGEAYTYCRRRWGDQAPARAFVPVSSFAVVQQLHGLAEPPHLLLLGGFWRRDDRAEWEDALRVCGYERDLTYLGEAHVEEVRKANQW